MPEQQFRPDLLFPADFVFPNLMVQDDSLIEPL
jgi:hypothetical protein